MLWVSPIIFPIKSAFIYYRPVIVLFVEGLSSGSRLSFTIVYRLAQSPLVIFSGPLLTIFILIFGHLDGIVLGKNFSQIGNLNVLVSVAHLRNRLRDGSIKMGLLK